MKRRTNPEKHSRRARSAPSHLGEPPRIGNGPDSKPISSEDLELQADVADYLMRMLFASPEQSAELEDQLLAKLFRHGCDFSSEGKVLILHRNGQVIATYGI